MRTLNFRIGNRTQAVAVLTCAAMDTLCAVFVAAPAGRVNLLLPVTGTRRFGGAQEVMTPPPIAAHSLIHRHASRLGAKRMVLAGAGHPQPASGPGHLL